MSTLPPHPLTSPTDFKSRIGLALIALTFVAMLSWSWNTWADPLVDFGTQLYLPWQILNGKVLYRDIAYYNGPVSQYFNTAAFAVLGVSLRTLVLTNIACVTCMVALIYRLARRTVGSIAATPSCIVFIILFGFNQFVGVSNYNWVTPYTNEITHGLVLGLLTIAMLNRYRRTNRTAWLIASGAGLGLTFLTKAEPFMATFAGAIALWAAHLWLDRPTAGQVIRSIMIFIASALGILVLAILLFSFAMPLSAAVTAIAGSWQWVFDPRIPRLPFYTHVQGTDDVPANIARSLHWLLAYAVFLVPSALIAMKTPRKSAKLFAAALFVIVVGILFWQGEQIDWSALTTPLPLCMIGIAIMLIIKSLRKLPPSPGTPGEGRGEGPLQLSLVIFSGCLLLKIIFNARIGHYGFALTAPATLVMTAILAGGLPRLINRRGGSGAVLQGTVLAVGVVVALAVFRIDDHFFSLKQWTLGTPPDNLRGDVVAIEVQQMDDLLLQTLPSNATLAVFPQGLMLNYLTRHPNPSRYLNFMPPEVLAAGEQKIIDDLKDHPPDAIVINASAVRNNQFILDADYNYGPQTFAWIQQNYEPVASVQLPPPYHTVMHLVLMRPKNKSIHPQNR